MFCHNCGKEIPDDTRFCPYCGTAQDVGQSASAWAPPPPAQPQPQPPSPAFGQEQESEHILTGILGALLCSLGGVAVMVLLDKLGYVSSLSGIVMLGCTVWGYAHFGKVMSKKGLVFSVLISIAMIYIGNGVYYGTLIVGGDWYKGARFFFSGRIPDAGYRVYEAYQENLYKQYAFAAAGMILLGINLFRGNRAAKKK